MFKVDKPLFIVLVTNGSCNLNCRYCYGAYGRRREYKDYSTKELLKIIDELKDLGVRVITLHGGESLLRRDIGEIFNYAKFKGFYISVNTNGYLVPKKIEELKLVDAVCISLDGRKESNDKNRGEGCYMKAMEAIDLIGQNNIPLVVSATLTKDSMRDVEFLAEMAFDKHFWIQYHILYNSDALKDRCSDIVVSDKEVRETIRSVLELKKKGYPVFWSENVLKTAVDWPFSYDKRYFIQKGEDISKSSNLIACYHGKLKYQIDADGRVVTCWAHDDPNAPNIKDIGVAEAIKQCHDNNICEYCAFLANNEHNALMSLGFKNIFNILCIHVKDVFKIKNIKA